MLWPFGFGLSYTTFSYKWDARSGIAAVHSIANVMAGTGIQYACTVTNTGSRAGDAVVMGFANSTDPQFPRQKLVDFERVALQPGESKTVLLTVTPEHLSVVLDGGRRLLRGASFEMRAGDVVNPAIHRFTLTGDEVVLDDVSAALAPDTPGENAPVEFVV